MADSGDHDSMKLSRRPVLTGIGGLGIAGLAGCISGDDIDIDGDAEELIYDGLQEEGVDLPVETTIYTHSESDERMKTAELIQNELNETDLFDVSFDALEWSSFLDLVRNMADEGENALICLGLSGSWDPHSYVYQAFHSDNAAPNGLNITHYENAEVDRLIDQGVEEPDHDERVDIYEQLQELLVEESPLSFVHFEEEVTIYQTDTVDGFQTFPVAGNEYKSIYAPTLGLYTELTTGETELIGDSGADIAAYDPTAIDDSNSMFATGLIYEQLLEIDVDGRVQPLLATDWEELDETTWRFELREGVEFHNGDEFTAADVQAAFERYDGTVRHADVYDWYADSEIRGDHEIDISLRRPYGPLETTIATLPIVPKAVANGDLDLADGPVGTGPYEFVEHDDATLWRMTANDTHWHDGSNGVPETPPIETITLRIIVDSASRDAALTTGDTHLSTSIPRASLAKFEDDDEFTVDRTVGSSFDFLAYPGYLEPFTNPKVRRGIGKLIPRERIVEDVYHGASRVAYTPVSPLLEEFVDPDFEAYIADEYVR